MITGAGLNGAQRISANDPGDLEPRDSYALYFTMHLRLGCGIGPTSPRSPRCAPEPLSTRSFDAWRTELLRHRASAKTLLARHAIDSWSDRKNVPYWQVHTTNLIAVYRVGPLTEGTTINFEPIASVDGQGFFLEDMYLITKDGAELLTPGVHIPQQSRTANRVMRFPQLLYFTLFY